MVISSANYKITLQLVLKVKPNFEIHLQSEIFKLKAPNMENLEIVHNGIK